MRGATLGSISALIAVASLAGCGKGDASGNPPGSSGASQVAQENGPQKLYEKLHAGAYQLDSALDNLQDARTALNEILSDQGGETKDALLNILDMLDSAGETLAQYNVSPDLAEVQKDAAAAEKRRAHAVEEAIDALREIRDARGTLGDMLASDPPKREKTALEKADDAINEGLEAVADGIKLLGGTPPAEENSSETPSQGP